MFFVFIIFTLCFVSSKYELPYVLSTWTDNGKGQKRQIRLGQFVDINGNGFLDLIYTFYHPTYGYFRAVYLNDYKSGSYQNVSCSASGLCSCTDLNKCIPQGKPYGPG